ncbi:MAG: alkaline phosphatase family protein [Candidatus Bathyarchaeota archaeon]|nr:MAG: alkaline phosphatase family protein [Candidatus Bathyarchaeota archaeon]
MKKVAMIGLDGMHWPILNKLFDWGVMPNLRKLAIESFKGTLRSTIPPESATAWTTIATGVNPGKHGIFGFTRPTKGYNDTRILNSQDVKYLRIHEMVAAQNLKSVCINQILTYPIKRFNGSSIITDWLSPEIKYSRDIERFAKGYHGPTLTKTSSLLAKNWNDEYSELSSRVDTTNALMKEIDWDLFWVVYSEPDHLFHRYYELVRKGNKEVMKLFAKMDETFGIVKDLVDLLIITSDHGFARFRHAIYINTFLQKLGLANSVKQEILKDLVCHRQVEEQKMTFQLPRETYRILSALPAPVELILSKIYKQLLKSDIKAEMTTYVDPKSSRAFAHGFGIYLKEKELTDRVVSILKKMQFVGGVWKKEDIYNGNNLEGFPDIVAMPNFSKGFALRSDTITPKSIVRRDFASHHPDGIVMIYKDEMKPRMVNAITVYDIVPTILNHLELEIPQDADGTAIKL